MRITAEQHVRPDGPNRRGVWSRLLRYWLEPIYYWLDLRDRFGRPDHGKIFSTVAFLFGLVGLAIFSPVVMEMCRKAVPGCGMVLAAFLAMMALVFAMAFGLAGYRVWAKNKGGGTEEALTTAINAEIAARRAQGGDYEVTR